MRIRYTVAAFIAAVLVMTTAGIAAAQKDPHEIYRGTMINLTTCVVPSLDEDDEFVLTNIVDVPAHPPLAGRVIYWVKDVDKIKQYVGKRIQFDANIHDVDRKEVEVKRSSSNGNGHANGSGHANGNGNGNGGTVVEIEVSGNQVKTTPDVIGISAAAPRTGEISIRTTTVELNKLANIRVVPGACNAGMMTAAAATTELAAETRTTAETALAANTRTEAAVEIPAAAETREVEVAVETAPTPAPRAEVAVESPAPTISSEIATGRTELPHTATPVPFVGLIGLAALGMRSALRMRRR